MRRAEASRPGSRSPKSERKLRRSGSRPSRQSNQRIRAGSGRLSGSDIARSLQAKLLADTVDRAGQLLAAALRRTPELGRDLGPFAPLGPQVEQPSLLGAEPPPHLVEQLAPGDDPAGAR